jgi:hypothetical protein
MKTMADKMSWKTILIISAVMIGSSMVMLFDWSINLGISILVVSVLLAYFMNLTKTDEEDAETGEQAR